MANYGTRQLLPTESFELQKNLKTILSRSKGYSMIPVVGTRDRRMSCSVGKYSGSRIRARSDKKLKHLNSCFHSYSFQPKFFESNLTESSIFSFHYVFGFTYYTYKCRYIICKYIWFYTDFHYLLLPFGGKSGLLTLKRDKVFRQSI